MTNIVEDNYERELAIAIMASLHDEQSLLDEQVIQESIQTEEARIASETSCDGSSELIQAESSELTQAGSTETIHITEVQSLSADYIADKEEPDAEIVECALCAEKFNPDTTWKCTQCQYLMCEECATTSFGYDSRCPGCREDKAGTVIGGTGVQITRRQANDIDDDEAFARELQEDLFRNDRILDFGLDDILINNWLHHPPINAQDIPVSVFIIYNDYTNNYTNNQTDDQTDNQTDDQTYDQTNS
jgi:hypothetical protein